MRITKERIVGAATVLGGVVLAYHLLLIFLLVEPTLDPIWYISTLREADQIPTAAVVAGLVFFPFYLGLQYAITNELRRRKIEDYEQ
ncbi:MAG: hypothetical protein ACUZ8A_06700 [Candidatus Bathyanammoxibius sp.]